MQEDRIGVGSSDPVTSVLATLGKLSCFLIDRWEEVDQIFCLGDWEDFHQSRTLQGSLIRFVLGCVIPRAGAVARSRNLGQALFGSPV